MKFYLNVIFLFFTFINSFANTKDSVIHFSLPDSVKAISFMAEIKVEIFNQKKYFITGIKTDVVAILLGSFKDKKKIEFIVSPASVQVASGLDVDYEAGQGFIFSYDWSVSETYKLLIAAAVDSSERFSLYSGYVWLPREGRWKLLGTVKYFNRLSLVRLPQAFIEKSKQKKSIVDIEEVWCQRQNGSWKNMLQTGLTSPVVNLYSHLDSLEQLQLEKKQITQAISENKTDVKQEYNGIYYSIVKEGTGKNVSADDTVTVFYKGYLFKDNSVFDETKDKPATFPLNRLIKGWQIGVPLCKVGGQIKLIIPSNLAYSIRTRSAKIPPNSILVFEIEVVDAKSRL